MNPRPSWRARAGVLAWYWLPVLAYMALIVFLSSRSDLPDVPGGISDKTVHGAIYAGLAVVFGRALAGPRGAVTLRVALAAVALSTAFGVTDEFHQAFVPGRDPDLRDLAADAVGAAAAAAAMSAWGIITRFRRVPFERS